ncbi:MAG: hypothetical protein APR53_09100 [Methanoculleus sp. SDB]|nr:MAG: hypothetical protein APR53_09100 [Methanoculleus sp. SDB]
MAKYQDYVIKDGEFIGKFEEMYREFEDPWHQSEGLDFSFSRSATIGLIKKFGIKSMVEFGCGLGHTTHLIKEKTGINIAGVDVSETAIKKAQRNYADIDFFVDNIENIAHYGAYENILFAEITWYILEDDQISRIFDSMMDNFKNNYFIHNLVFYHGQQKYGNNYFTSLDEFIEFCPFQYIGSVISDFIVDETSETSSIYKITKK